MSSLSHAWVYLEQTPLLWLTVTLGIFLLCGRIYLRSGCKTIFNPMIITTVVLVILLLLTKTPYKTYFEGAHFIHFILGPATVALAIPLYRFYKILVKLFFPIALSLLTGCLVGTLSAVGMALLFRLSNLTVLSLAPKSVTTPIAMGVSEQIGGSPSLTTVFVILTGVFGSLLGPWVLNLCRVKNPSVRGFALGVASHGLGTATAFHENEQAGAFAGLGMGLNGAITALIAPFLLHFLGLI